MTALTWFSKSTGSTTTLRGGASKRPERMGVALAGSWVIKSRCFSEAHWPTRPSPIRRRSSDVSVPRSNHRSNGRSSRSKRNPPAGSSLGSSASASIK